jgi:spore maturation protein CgeB
VSQGTWFIVVPPHGAARQAGLLASAAFESILGKDKCRSFDCGIYLRAFSDMLKKPDETMVVDLLNHALIVQCLGSRATHLLVLALSPVTLFTLNLARAQGVKTAHWFFEDFRRAVYWKDVLAGYDYFFAIQKGPIIAECERHKCRFAFLPAAASIPANVQNTVTAAERPVDVAFVGIPSSYRVAVLELLAINGVSLAIAGSGWDRYQGPLHQSIVNANWTEEKQAMQILLSAKIGINLSVNSPDQDRSNTHVSPRVFDICAAGCSLVTENVPLAPDTMPGLAYRTFDTNDGALATVETVLSEYPSLSSEIVDNQKAIAERHTYANRAGTIIAECGMTC